MERELEQAFVETRLVCGDCGHELEDDEINDQRAEVKEYLDVDAPAPALVKLGLLRCLDCGSDDVREIDVDLRDELLRLAHNAGETARMIVERRPEMAPRVGQALAEARSRMETLAG